MVRILVTGASGFLGSWLCRLAMDRGHTVAGTYYTAEPDIALDRTLQHKLPAVPRNEVESFAPDAIVHSAALSGVELCETEPDMAVAVNVRGSQNMASLAADVGADFTQVSTNFVFGGPSCAPYIEEDATDPDQVYGETKLDAEKAVLSVHPEPLIVRVSDLYGPSLRPEEQGFVRWLVDSLQAGDTVSLVRDMYMSPTYVVSAAKEILSLLESERKGVYHRSGSSCVNRVEFGYVVADVFRLDTMSIEECNAADIWNASRPYCTCLSSRRIGEALPLTYESVAEGLTHARERFEN